MRPMQPLQIDPRGKLRGDRRHPLSRTRTWHKIDGTETTVSYCATFPRWARLKPTGKAHIVANVSIHWNTPTWDGIDLIVVGLIDGWFFHLNNPMSRDVGIFVPQPHREVDTCGRCFWRLVWTERQHRIQDAYALEKIGRVLPPLPALLSGASP